MTYRALLPIALIVSLAGLPACQQQSASGPAKKADAGQVLAEINGATITTTSFQKEVEMLPAYLKPMAETAEGRKELLDTMIIRELMLQEAQKEGIDKKPEIAEKLEDLKKRLVVEAYLRKKVETEASLTDANLQKFYDENKDKFKTGEQVHASHILVKTEKEAKDILAELKAGGNFEALARKHSTDGAAAKGGDLGWFGRGSMIPEFEKVAFGLKEGELSGVVQTKFGFHIIKVTGKRPAGVRTFAEVKDQIRELLVPEKQQEIFKKLREDLKKNAKFTIKEDALKSLDAAPASPATPNAAPQGAAK